MSILAFGGGSFDLLREELLKSELETAAIILASSARTPSDNWRLLVREVIFAPDAAYVRRGRDHITLQPEFLARVFKRARALECAVLLTHTHPFGGRIEPSPVDIDGESRLLPALFGRVPNGPHGRVIIGKENAHAAVFSSATSEAPLGIAVVGNDIRQPSYRVRHDSAERNYASRQVLAFGDVGQEMLEETHVAIVGVGGTGSVVAQQLAHLGVKRFLLIDPDTIEATNLNRVVGTTPMDVGRFKVEVCAEMIRAIRPSADVEAITESALQHHTVRRLLDVDAFFCCTDSHGSRAVLSQFAYQYYVPAFDVGVRIDVVNGTVTHITGRVQMLAPGLPCLLCGDLLDPEQVRRDLMSEFERRHDPYIVGAPIAQPAVISINSTVASLGVTMFLSAVTGLPLRARHQIVRFDTGMVRAVAGEQVPGCVVCSSQGALGRADDWTLPGRT